MFSRRGHHIEMINVSHAPMRTFQSAGIFGEISYATEGLIFGSELQQAGWPFTGRIRYGPSQLEGNFQTSAPWSQAFGLEYLTIKNTNIR